MVSKSMESFDEVPYMDSQMELADGTLYCGRFIVVLPRMKIPRMKIPRRAGHGIKTWKFFLAELSRYLYLHGGNSSWSSLNIVNMVLSSV